MLRQSRRIIFLQHQLSGFRISDECHNDGERNKIRCNPLPFRLSDTNTDLLSVIINKTHRKTSLEIPRPARFALHRERAFDNDSGLRLRNADIGSCGRGRAWRCGRCCRSSVTRGNWSTGYKECGGENKGKKKEKGAKKKMKIQKNPATTDGKSGNCLA